MIKIIVSVKCLFQESPVYLLKKHRDALDSLQSYRNFETDKERCCDVNQSWETNKMFAVKNGDDKNLSNHTDDHVHLMITTTKKPT